MSPMRAEQIAEVAGGTRPEEVPVVDGEPMVAPPVQQQGKRQHDERGEGERGSTVTPDEAGEAGPRRGLRPVAAVGREIAD